MPGLADTARGLVLGSGTVLLAFGVAALGLSRRRSGPAPRQIVRRVLIGPARALDRLHTSHVGDYLAWAILGAAVLRIAFALG